MLNYMRHPFKTVNIDEDMWPSNEEANGHVVLKNFGVKTSDLKDIRFRCSVASDHPRLLHFKSDSEEIKLVAVNGDQNALTPTSFSSVQAIVNTEEDAEDQAAAEIVASPVVKGLVNETGKNSTSSFTRNLFGYKVGTKELNWTIQGTRDDVPNKKIFECDNKESIADVGAYETHHQVWVRFMPPS